MIYLLGILNGIPIGLLISVFIPQRVRYIDRHHDLEG